MPTKRRVRQQTRQTLAESRAGLGAARRAKADFDSADADGRKAIAEDDRHGLNNAIARETQAIENFQRATKTGRFGRKQLKKTALSPDLAAEWNALKVEYEALCNVQRSLEQRSDDRDAHQRHLRNLHAHTEKIHAFIRRL